MISISNDGAINVHWTQNGIRNKKTFRSMKQAGGKGQLLQQ